MRIRCPPQVREECQQCMSSCVGVRVVPLM
jgi:hypothetical protein